MLFPLSKDFSSSSIFQKSGDHHARPIKRVWSIDKTGSAERTKELHKLLTDQKPYRHHEQLAAKKAKEGQKQDAETMRLWRDHLGDMNARIDGESTERRREMYQQIRDFNNRRAASNANLTQTMRDQAKGHGEFLNDMSTRVQNMPPIMGDKPPRETVARTQARTDAFKAVTTDAQAYKRMIGDLRTQLDNRGDQEWAAQPKPSNDAIVKKRKAAGLAVMTQAKEDYEAVLEGIADQEHRRFLQNRRELRKLCRESEDRLTGEKSRLSQSMGDLHAAKRGELDAIQARVNGRGSGRPDHPEFVGYATAGYIPVHKSNSRLRDHAAEQQDKDADHAESASRLLCLSMPLSLRNRIVAAKPPKKQDSLRGTGLTETKEWTELNWTQRWALISTHAPQRAVQKAHEKAGVDAQGNELNSTMNSLD
jgi:hypothetical protein